MFLVGLLVGFVGNGLEYEVVTIHAVAATIPAARFLLWLLQREALLADPQK
jgi:hypothetical protein